MYGADFIIIIILFVLFFASLLMVGQRRRRNFAFGRFQHVVRAVDPGMVVVQRNWTRNWPFGNLASKWPSEWRIHSGYTSWQLVQSPGRRNRGFCVDCWCAPLLWRHAYVSRAWRRRNQLSMAIFHPRNKFILSSISAVGKATFQGRAIHWSSHRSLTNSKRSFHPATAATIYAGHGLKIAPLRDAQPSCTGKIKGHPSTNRPAAGGGPSQLIIGDFLPTSCGNGAQHLSLLAVDTISFCA